MAAVTPTASVEEFVSAIEKSRLLSAAALAKLREAATQTTDPKQLARDLIKDDLLTKWQATQLLHTYSALIMGRYELLDDLGASGLARVYLVEHVQMKRRHALKVLSKRQTAQPEIVKQFLADAQQACKLEHPNLSRIYDVNQDGDRYYVVMEYIEGQSLERLVTEKGKLTVAEAADFARQTAAGLAHAHQHGVIHGDLKPANLLLDASGTIKILEIGQAKLGGSATADRASDAYSLGSVLCFLLTGKLPENAAAAADQLKQVADLPTEIAALVSRLMADQPANRPASLTEVQEQLARASEAAGPLLEIKIDDEEPSEKNKSGPLLVAKRLEAVAAEGPQAISGGFAIQTGNRGPKKPLTAPAAKPAAAEAKPKSAPAKVAAEVESEEVEFKEAASTQADGAPAPAASQDQKTNTKLIVAAAIGGGGVLALGGIIALVVAFFGGSREKQVAQNKPAAVKPAVATPAPAPAAETNPLANPEANPEVNPTVEPAAPPAAPAAEARPAAVSAVAAGSTLPVPSPPPVAAAKADSEAAKTEKKAEPKPDAKTETKPEAKPAAKPAAAKAEPAKTPPKPEPPKAPPNPLNGFAKEVALPELPLMGEPPTDVLAPVELGPCKVDEKMPIAVRLLGGESVIRGGKQKFDLQPAASSPGREWGFQLVGAESPALIATLSAQKGKLLFQWSAEAAKQPAAANLLCNCALELQAGPGHITVPLRKPVLGTPLNVQVEKAGEDVKWVIPNLPDPKHTLIQILRCDGPVKYITDPAEPVTPGDPLTLWMGPEEKLQVLGLKLTTTANLRGVTSAPLLKVAGMRPQPFRKREFADQLKKKGQELQVLMGQLNGLSNPPAQLDNNTKKRLDESKALVTVQTKSAQAEVDQLSQLATFISEAQTAGKIHFRVFYKASDVEVDLLYTSEDRKPAPPPAPPADKKAAAAPATATATPATKAADDAKAKKAADDAKAKKAAEDAKAKK